MSEAGPVVKTMKKILFKAVNIFFSTAENEQMCKYSYILQRTILATGGSYQYWRFNCQWFPGLAAAALKYLCAPCTSIMPVSDLGLNTAKSWNILFLSESYEFIQKPSAPSSGENLIKLITFLLPLSFFCLYPARETIGLFRCIDVS